MTNPASELVEAVERLTKVANGSHLSHVYGLMWHPKGRNDLHLILSAIEEMREATIEQCALVLWKAADDLAHEPEPEYDDHRHFAAGCEHGFRQALTAIRALSRASTGNAGGDQDAAVSMWEEGR